MVTIFSFQNGPRAGFAHCRKLAVSLTGETASARVSRNTGNNSNVVRALAALSDEDIAGWYEAYAECVKEKRSSRRGVRFAMDAEMQLASLIADVYTGRYAYAPYEVFAVSHPKPREIFSAEFRDRIVHHWIVSRLRPLVEGKLNGWGDRVHSNRRGHGCLTAVQELDRMMSEVSGGYRTEAWVAKVDIRAFFPSVDRRIAFRMLCNLIRREYGGGDARLLVELIRRVLPLSCGIRCNVRRSAVYDSVPAHKRIAGRADFRGLPIGNLLSQTVACYLMGYALHLADASLGRLGVRYVCYADDVALVGKTTEAVREAKRIVGEVVERVGLAVNRDKSYCQRVSHGVEFLGFSMRPHRMHSSRRQSCMLRGAMRRLAEACASGCNAAVIDRCAASVNSYLGCHAHGANLRARLAAWLEVRGQVPKFYSTEGCRSVRRKKHVNIINTN